MADSRKRGAPHGSSSARPRQRSRSAALRQETLKRVAAVAVIALVLTAVTTTVLDRFAPKTRRPVHEPPRLVWEEHKEDLERRGLFRRMYRMELHTFEKLAELVRPILEPNDYYARKRTRNGAVPVELRLALALRMLAGAAYMDVAVVFGIAKETVYHILWEVVDAINNTPEVGPFYFPQTVDECTRQARSWEPESTGGALQGVVAAVGGLFVKAIAPSVVDTPNVLSYYSGSKCGYGLNIQATCDPNHRFCSMSCIAPGAMNDCVAWTSSELAEAVGRLPEGFYVLGDAAYPLSEQLLTPYPGEGLAPDKDSLNFHLGELRIKVEQAFGILVSQWGILWKPLRLKFTGRSDMVTALFHLHNFLRDENSPPITPDEEDEESGRGRPVLADNSTLPELFRTSPVATEMPGRSDDVANRMAVRVLLDDRRQYRPAPNMARAKVMESSPA